MNEEIIKMFTAQQEQLRELAELIRRVQENSNKVLEVVELLSEKLLPYQE